MAAVKNGSKATSCPVRGGPSPDTRRNALTAVVELQTNVRKDFTIMEKALLPTWAHLRHYQETNI